MGGAYKLQNIIYDPGIESAIPDFIIRSESAENDFFSKPRLHCIYEEVNGQFTLRTKYTKKQGQQNYSKLYFKTSFFSLMYNKN